MVTIHDLVTELQSFTKVPQETLDKAEASLIDDLNDKDFQVLTDEWTCGAYDNDPELLLQRLTTLLNK